MISEDTRSIQEPTRTRGDANLSSYSVVLFFLMSGALITGAFLYFQSQRNDILKQESKELEAVAEVKLAQITDWRNERLHDATFILNDPGIAELASRYQSNPGDLPTEQKMRSWMQSFLQSGNYRYLTFLDATGKAIIALRADSVGPPDARPFLASAEQQKVIFPDFFLDKNGKPWIHLIVSLRSGGKLIGFIQMVVDPYHHFYPMLQKWMKAYDSAEIMIVRREGNHALLLNDLRYRANAAMKLRLAISIKDLPAAIAARGGEGIHQGIDYRGIPVLSVQHKVPGTPWVIVAKIDLKEMYAPLRTQAGLLALLLLACILTFGLTALLRLEKHKRLQDNENKKILDRFELVVRLASDAILLIDEDLKIREANEKAAEMYGYSIPELLTLSLADLRSEHSRKELQSMVSQLREKGSLIYEAQQQRKDGTIFDVEVSIATFQWQGQTFYQGIARDIESRRKAEAELRDNRALLSSIVEGTIDCVFAKNLYGSYILMNRATREVFGIPVELTRNAQIFPADEARAMDAIDREVIALKETRDFEERLSCPDGSERFFHTIKGPIQDSNGDIVGLFGIARDITERKKSEQQLRKLQRAVDQSSASIVITDVGGKIEYVNKRFTLITGFDPEEVIGHNPRILKSGLMKPDMYAQLWKTILSGKEWKGELCNKKKNGELFWEDVSISPIRDPEGNVTHFVAVKEDITLKKSLEDQLLRAQRLESIGTLAAGIAHDLNNVLAPILISVALLRERVQDDLSQDMLSTLDKAAVRGKDIVSQVLLFARGKESEKIALNPSHVLKEIGTIARETFPRNIEIVVEISQDISKVFADVTQLHQVLMNLSLNARDAMPNGGTLELGANNISLDEQSVTVFYGLKPGKYVRFFVRDTGTGIPAECLERIFDPFFTTKEPGKGTGLGLSTAFTIVRKHNGFIDVKSAPGDGSTFFVFIPAIDTKPAEMLATPQVALRGHGEGILIIDDEPSVRDVTRQILQTFGYTPYVAMSGIDGIELYRQNQKAIQLVIADWMMPGMSGAETIQGLRNVNPEVKALVATGLLDESENGPMNFPGVSKTLIKPFRAHVLLESIHEALARDQMT